MDEENISHALIIGVSTFISVMVVSAVIMFYNSGVSIVKKVGAGSNSYSEINREDVEATLLMSGTGNYIKGTNVINLLNQYLNDAKILVTVNNIKYIDNNGNIQALDVLSMDSNDLTVREASYNQIMRYIMDNQDFTINVQDANDSIGSKIITIEGV